MYSYVYPSYELYRNELVHHGILGQRWGKRNGPPYPLTANAHSASELNASSNSSVISEIKKSGHYTKNIDEFGKDADHNVLFVTGLSGSGKSTISEKFKNANKIHLDFYIEEGDPEETRLNMDDEFNDFMKKKGIEYQKIPKLPFEDKERWRITDQLGDAIMDFSKQQYRKGKNVIVEGVQITDQTLYPDKSFFKDKSMVILGTSSFKSLWRSMERDGISPFDVACVMQRMKWNKIWSKGMKDLKKL